MSISVTRQWVFFVLFIIAADCGAGATTYYVSASHGGDNNDGRSVSRPWKTIARVNRQQLKAGDSVLFRRGDSWCETLKPTSSGRKGRPITFDAYGSGAKPVLRGQSVPGGIADFSIDNNEQSHLTYGSLDLRGAREGLRLYSWSAAVTDITLRNSVISTVRSETDRTMSAGVYASVNTGTLSGIIIRDNTFNPYPAGLQHWGIYFVKGVTKFRIENNRFGPAGEDAICIWHSSDGVIAGNRGGGNGENTIDVKDSHDVLIAGNLAEHDMEYNIVIHSVDSNDLTYNIIVEKNRCMRGGQGGKLSAGIVLLSVRNCKVRGNHVEDAYGDSIAVVDAVRESSNEVSHNLLVVKGRGRRGIVLEKADGTRVTENVVQRSGSDLQ